MDNIHKAFSADFLSEEIKKNYKKWASTYDNDVKKCNYRGPKVIKFLLNNIIVSDKRYEIGDFGCGSGLVGNEITSSNTIIDGFDLSKDMLNLCNKEVYRNLYIFDFNDNHNDNEKKYDIITCCGTFTHGHVEINRISQMFNYLKNNGCLIFSIRKSFYEKYNCERKLKLIFESEFEIIQIIEEEYIEDDGAFYYIVKKINK